jgi:chromosome segregation ATPase
MKKVLFTIAIVPFIAAAILTGCQSSGTKVENAEQNVQDAKDKVEVAQQELNQAIKDSIQQFRKDEAERISANEKSIVEFKAKIAKEDQESKARNEQRLAELEQQNRDMKTRLEQFKEDTKDNWEAFSFKFKHDMDNLGQAFKAFVVKRK